MKNATRRRRLSLTISLAVAALAGAVLTVAAPSGSAAEERDPVIFVHGWMGGSYNWGGMTSAFSAAGYPASHLHAWNYNTMQSNEKTAQELASLVDQVLEKTGASKVDLVSHSMGGLNTRWFVKFGGGDAKVDDWVSLGGPNHGTQMANVCFGDSCTDMRPGSPFLTKLNGGDETPGSVNYGTFWSECDGIILPANSTELDGAKNTKLGCVTHMMLLMDGGVTQQVIKFVA